MYINPFSAKGFSFEGGKSSGVKQSKIYKYVLGTEGVKGDSFLTPSVPRGFPLTCKIVWR